MILLGLINSLCKELFVMCKSIIFKGCNQSGWLTKSNRCGCGFTLYYIFRKCIMFSIMFWKLRLKLLVKSVYAVLDIQIKCIQLYIFDRVTKQNTIISSIISTQIFVLLKFENSRTNYYIDFESNTDRPIHVCSMYLYTFVI